MLYQDKTGYQDYSTGDTKVRANEDSSAYRIDRVTPEMVVARFPDREWSMYVLRACTPAQLADIYDQKKTAICRLDDCFQTFACGSVVDVENHLASDAHNELRHPNGPYIDNWRVYCMWRLNDAPIQRNLMGPPLGTPLVCGATLTASEFAAHIQQVHLPETVNQKPKWCL